MSDRSVQLGQVTGIGTGHNNQVRSQVTACHQVCVWASHLAVVMSDEEEGVGQGHARGLDAAPILTICTPHSHTTSHHKSSVSTLRCSHPHDLHTTQPYNTSSSMPASVLTPSFACRQPLCAAPLLSYLLFILSVLCVPGNSFFCVAAPRCPWLSGSIGCLYQSDCFNLSVSIYPFSPIYGVNVPGKSFFCVAAPRCPWLGGSRLWSVTWSSHCTAA